MDNAAKGELAGVCARFLCRCKPARWHDAEETKAAGRDVYVCDGCAADANGRSWLNRNDGSPCCHLVEDEVPRQVPIQGYYI